MREISSNNAFASKQKVEILENEIMRLRQSLNEVQLLIDLLLGKDGKKTLDQTEPRLLPSNSVVDDLMAIENSEETTKN